MSTVNVGRNEKNEIDNLSQYIPDLSTIALVFGLAIALLFVGYILSTRRAIPFIFKNYKM